MKTESNIRPSVEFEVEAIPKAPGRPCTVIFYDNIQGPLTRPAEGENAEGEEYFTFDRYEVQTTYREGLDGIIEENKEAWLEAAKKAEEDAAAEEVRSTRNKLLEEIDWTQTIDAPISAKSRSELRTYRQQLRDITEQEGFPYEVEWPVRPAIEKADPDPADEALDVLIGQEDK